jgi:tetratricopeptide (TPR) repeat protein
MRLFFLYSILLISLKSIAQNTNANPAHKEAQQKIVDEYVHNCAKNYSFYQMAELQECLDEGLKKDYTIAYLWQQKAMPLFKMKKYEAGMVFCDKAVEHDPQRWLSYRAYIKCIFAKTYREAIIDFEKCKEMHGNSYEMDHTYNFYIALSHLQLNEFAKAEEIFNTDILEQIEQKGEAHHLDLFYYGISLYEQKKWEQAIEEFDKAISQYENFSDAKVYKAFCLGRIGQEKRANDLLLEAKADAKNGYTINEDNMIHEVYPYKVKW